MRLPMLKRTISLIAFVCVAWFTANARASQVPLPGTVELSPLPLDRTQAAPLLATLGLSSSVLSAGSLAFEGGYDPADWSGTLQAVSLKPDGTRGDVVWNAAAILTNALFTPPDRRVLLTAAKNASGTIAGMAFRRASAFDAGEIEGLMSPESVDATRDMLATRVDYLRGVRLEEQDGVMRTRTSLLGAIIHSQAVYVGHPSARYSDNWPTKLGDVMVPAPEMAAGTESYASFAERHAHRASVLYVGANDGMLHAFSAPLAHCAGSCRLLADAGKELWAYLPRAIYASLGALSHAGDFQFQPSVDATPVMRDVFFSQHGRHEWHSVLVGGLGLGGRGIYALDITDPAAASEVFPERSVLWEFDADAAAGTTNSGTRYTPADLGYTYGQPAIARLANGHWAVLVPSGYFPDCNHADQPLHCDEVAAQTPPQDSALFVLDAQTGEVVSELKTSSAPDGATSYGLTTPVLGDYNNDQIDDVAFAGDLAGNLWRFDLSAPNPVDWKVSLAYQPAVAQTQPITTMPRLFPDPATHRFIVVFGTGKYLGDGDRAATIPTQSVYGIRDKLDSRGHPLTAARDDLQAQTLSEAKGTDAALRNLTSHPVPPKAAGWYVDLDLVPGERVVATPTALFNTNTVLISTLIPDNDPHGMPQAAVLAVDAATGGPGNAISFGGVAYAGGRLSEARGAKPLAVATAMGGGRLIVPGVSLKSAQGGVGMPLSFDSPLWRRRSWAALTPDD